MHVRGLHTHKQTNGRLGHLLIPSLRKTRLFVLWLVFAFQVSAAVFLGTQGLTLAAFRNMRNFLFAECPIGVEYVIQ